MSEVIVRMEMPRECWCCPNGHPDWIYNDDGAAQMVCFCNICNTEEDDRCISETETERPSWCPIIGELPDHGDLIDRDELKKHKRHSEEFCENIVSVAQIDWMPTIVPATERSET